MLEYYQLNIPSLCVKCNEASQQLLKKEHPMDFQILWVCNDCGMPSLYYADMEEHLRQKNHHYVSGFDLDTGKMVAAKHDTA